MGISLEPKERLPIAKVWEIRTSRHTGLPFEKNQPVWTFVEQDDKGFPMKKPLVRCNCGQWLSLVLHTLNSDGHVMETMWHPVCGWHVHLKLERWNGGPVQKGQP